MRNLTLAGSGFWIALNSGLCFAMPALAMDPACQTVLAVQSSLKNKAFHLYMTTERKWSANLSKAAASIGAGGVKKSEEIWTGKDVYVLNDGKWIDMHTDFATLSDVHDDPDAKKARDAEQCRELPNETVFGQLAAVYETHNPELGVNDKIWVSKGNHLLIKSESTTDVGSMKNFTSMRYDYGNVQPPSNVVSISDMVKK